MCTLSVAAEIVVMQFFLPGYLIVLLGTERTQTGGGRMQIYVFQVGPIGSVLLVKSGWFN